MLVMLCMREYVNQSCMMQCVLQTSSGSFNTVKGPSYSGLGVYSKSSTSAPITSRLVMR